MNPSSSDKRRRYAEEGRRTDAEAALRLQAMDVEAHLSDPARKQELVTPLFDFIAPQYDRFTRVFSFGMDRGWKAQTASLVTTFAPPQAVILDLACGTGDLAFAAAGAAPHSRVTGIDTSERMVALAERRRNELISDWSEPIEVRMAAGRIAFVVGSMTALRADDASVDVVTVGYGVRNAPSTDDALREIARVLKPGGHLITLDFYRPRSSVWRAAFLAYLRAAGSLVGWLWHRAPMAYGYIAPSIEHFMSWQDFGVALERAGFEVTNVRTKLFGGIAIHHGVKTRDRRPESRVEIREQRPEVE